MPDNLKKRGRADRQRISLTEQWEVRDWCDRLECTELELREAVDQVGHMADDVRAYLKPPPPLTDDQVKHMVNRFLCWRLPENFHPDAGISFKPDFNEHTAHPMKHQPTGTNLFDADQADAMVRHMIARMPAS